MKATPPSLAVPATSVIALEAIRKVERIMCPDRNPPHPGEHVFHAGCYARTVRMTQGQAIISAMVKVPTLLIVSGSASILLNDGWEHLEGYNVIPAAADRKQIILAHSDVALTTVFQTNVRTLEEAERVYTDERDIVLAHKRGGDLCLE